MTYYEVEEKVVSPDNEYVEIDEDAEIISTVRHGTGVKMTLLTPKELVCGYIKDDGEPCEIIVNRPDQRCHHHE